MNIPGLGDTLNHLARMHILMALSGSPSLQRFYVVHWSPIPYLAMDAVVPVLARVMSLTEAAKVFVACCVLMPFLGAATLHYVVHRRISLVPAAALLLGANYLLALGFLNYLFMAGLAVMVFAGWVACAEKPRVARAAIFWAPATILYFGHAFAFGGYCCAVAGFEVFRALRRRFQPWRGVVLDGLAASAQALPALYFAATLNANAGAPGKLYNHYGDVTEKLLALASPLLFLVDPVQLGVLVACLIALAVIVRRLRVDPGIAAASLAVFLVALAVPEILLSTWLTDFRLPLFAAMVFLGGVTIAGGPRLRLALGGVLTLCLVAKSLDTGRVLRRLDGQIAQMRLVLRNLPPGARLLVANESGPPAGQPRLSGSTIWTMPLLAVMERDAFIPYLFTGLTTVHMRPEFAALSTPQGGPVTLLQLADDLAGRPPKLLDVERREGLRVYWHDWRQNFDFLLVEHFDSARPSKVPDHLALVADAGEVGLYRIQP